MNSCRAAEIDDLYLIRPYYIAPDGKVGQDAFAVIRNVIRQMNMVAIGRVVLTSREHVIALEARGKGLMGTLLRYPYEVRDENEYFDDIQDLKLSKDMMDLAQHIVKTKTGHFKPEKFEDHYETALKELVEKKIEGHQDRSAARARRADQGHQSHGCAAPQRTLRARDRWQENRQARTQADRGPEGNALPDLRQEAGEGSGAEIYASGGPTEGRIKLHRLIGFASSTVRRRRR